MITVVLYDQNPTQVLHVNTWAQVTITYNGDRSVGLFANNPSFGSILPATAGMNLPVDSPVQFLLAPGSTLYAATNGPNQTFSMMVQDLPDLDLLLQTLVDISNKLGPGSINVAAPLATGILPKKTVK